MKIWLKMVLPVLAAITLSSQAYAADKFKVGYLRVMDDAAAITAFEAGMYKKQGVDVDLVEFKSGTDMIKAIVGGQVDTGILGFTNAIAWASRGADLKVIGGAQQGYHALIVRDDANIKTVADLKGKTIASQAKGSTADTVLNGVVLAQAGLKPSDLNVIGVSPAVSIQSLVGKRVDGAFLFEPYASLAKLVAPAKEIYEIGQHWPFPCMVVITSEKVLQARKDDVWKTLNAQKEAIDLLKNQPENAAKLIAKYFITEPTVKTLSQGEVAREKVITDAIKTQVFSADLNAKDIARMQELAGIMEKDGSLKSRDGKPFDVKSILDLSWQEGQK